MLISRAPLRISFVGGGTDIKDFYSEYPGRVISTTIDKYVYVVINHAEFLNEFMLKYSQTEIVKNIDDIQHNRFREALKEVGIRSGGMEIASFADLPSKTGLGSSSSFSVALIKALYANKGKKISKEQVAREACKLEIDILKEPIGKQDQYAVAYGGLNIFQFNKDDTVTVEPVFVDFKTQADFEEHMLFFYTGITRSASSVLSEQKSKIKENFEIYKKMSDSVYEFRDKLIAGDFKALGEMLHHAWTWKKKLSSKMSGGEIDALYESALRKGAWGGKVLGAGGGGCLLFLAPPKKHAAIRQELSSVAESFGLKDSRLINFMLTNSGADVLFNTANNDHA